jgi:hypothetical protein
LFLCWLATALGKTLRQIGQEVSARELRIWQIAAKLDDFAGLGDAVAAGQVPVTAAQLVGGRSVRMEPGTYSIRRRTARRKPAAARPAEPVGERMATLLGLKLVPHDGQK